MLANRVIVYGPIVLYTVQPNNWQRFAHNESVSHRLAFCVVVLSSSCGLIIYHGDIGCFRNVDRILLYYTASQPRRQYVSKNRKYVTTFPIIIFYFFSVCSVIKIVILYIFRATVLHLQSPIPNKLLRKRFFIIS